MCQRFFPHIVHICHDNTKFPFLFLRLFSSFCSPSCWASPPPLPVLSLVCNMRAIVLILPSSLFYPPLPPLICLSHARSPLPPPRSPSERHFRHELIMPHLPSFAVSRSLCLAPMTSTPKTVTVETKAVRHRDATNCMIANLSIHVSQRSGSVSCGCGKVPVWLEAKLSWEILDSVLLLCQCLPSPFASRNGCSQCKYIWSDHVSSLTGRAGKFLHRHNSESPVSEGMAGLLSAHFVLAGILSPIHRAPHRGTMDREEEWENNQEWREREKGLSWQTDWFSCFSKC